MFRRWPSFKLAFALHTSQIEARGRAATLRFPGSDLGVERFGRRRLRPAKGVRVSRSSKGPSRRMPGIPGFFDGDFRSVSKTRVALGGASRREQQDKKALLEQARKDREKRSQNRAEVRSASRIQVGAPPRDPESSLGTPSHLFASRR